MCHWKRWIVPGLLTVGLLSLVAFFTTSPLVERDLTAKGNAQLSSAGYGWARVEMDGRDATVVGVAPDENLDDPVLQAAGQAYSMRVVTARTELLAARSPYTLKAVRDGDAVTLSGFVPNEAARTEIMAAAAEALPDVAVDDELRLARGAPAGLVPAVAFGLQQLAGLTRGEVDLVDAELSVRGDAATTDAFDSVQAALAGALPGDTTLAEQAVTAPVASPYEVSAIFDGTTVRLEGFAPDAEARAAAEAAARELLPDAQVANQIRIASGAPEGYEEQLRGALAVLPRLSEGSVLLSDGALTAGGTAASSADFETVTDALDGTLPGEATLASREIAPPGTDDYVIDARYDGSAVVLTGVVPDRATRDAIQAEVASRLPDATVENRLAIAAGAPAGYVERFTGGLDYLSEVSRGSVNLNGERLAVEGAARDVDAYEAAIARAADIADTDVVTITPAIADDYNLVGRYDGSALSLSGFVPDEAARERILRAAATALPNATVSDELRIAGGSPADWTARVEGALAYLPRFSEGSIELRPDALAVQGKALTSQDYSAATAAAVGADVRGTPLAALDVVPPAADSYGFAAQYDGNAVVLEGNVPDQAGLDAIEAALAATLPDATIDNRLKFAAGAPDGYLDRAAASVAYLARLRSGRVTLSDGALDIEGQARSLDDYEAATNALSGPLPADLSLRSARIAPVARDPYEFQAARDGNDVTLTGFAPGPERRDEIATEAESALPSASVDNRLRVATGEPDGFDALVARGLAALGRLSEGSVTLDGSGLRIEGLAADSDAYDAVTKEAGSDDTTAVRAPDAERYGFDFTRSGDTITLGGFAPDAERREAVERTVAEAAPGVAIENRLRIAPNAPDDYDARVERSADFLSRVDDGAATLDGPSYALRGRLREVDDFDATIEGAGDADVSRVTAAEASPYTFRARTGGDGVVLEGFAPDIETRDRIAADARNAVPEARIDNRLRIASGAPDGFDARVAQGLAFLPKVESGSASLTDDALVLEGRARTPGDYEALLSAPNGASVDGVLPATVDGYELGATKTATGVELTGYVPDDATRQAVEEQARAVGTGQVVNSLQIADGAPDGFGEAVAKAIGQLNRFSAGSVSMRDLVLTVEGDAKTSRDYVEARSVNRSLTAMTLESEDIRPPMADGDYVTRIIRSPSSVVLEGLVPSEDARTALSARAGELVPGARVVNRTTIARGQAEGYDAILERGVDLLSGLETGSATLTGETLDIEGQAGSPDAYDAVIAELEKPLAGGAYGERVVRPAAVSPYEWSVRAGDEGVTLEGYVPSRADGDRIATLAEKRLERTVQDRQRVASGEPEGFLAAVERLIERVGELEQGQASIRGSELRIEGQATSEADAARIEEELTAALDETFTLQRQITFPEPAPAPAPAAETEAPAAPEAPTPEPEPEAASEPAVARETAATSAPPVALEPDAAPEQATAPEQSVAPVPGAEAEPTAEAAEPEPVAEPAVVDEPAVAETEPQPEAAPVVEAAPVLEVAPVVEVAPSTEAASQTAVAPAPETVPAPEVAAVEQEPAAQAPANADAVCGVDFVALFEGEKINFATNRAVIRKSSHPLLDRIADAKKTCPDTRFQIAGHTDSRGRDEFNERLSIARAEAVRDYMIEAGVPADSMDARGFGETRPIASNRNRAGRAANRRIEFTIIRPEPAAGTNAGETSGN